MRVVITIEDTREGIVSSVQVFPNGVCVDAQNSLACMLTAQLGEHIERMKKLGALVAGEVPANPTKTLEHKR